MKRMRSLRKEAGVTMKEVGVALGLSESTVSLYENGKRSPDVQTLIQIADYFNVSLDTLCGRDFESRTLDLSQTESFLLNAFKKVNKEGQDKIISYVEDLLSTGKYIKSDKAAMVSRK